MSKYPFVDEENYLLLYFTQIYNSIKQATQLSSTSLKILLKLLDNKISDVESN